MLEFLCKTKCSLRSSCVSFEYFARRNNSCSCSLIHIVREGKHDADFIQGKKIHPVSKLYY